MSNLPNSILCTSAILLSIQLCFPGDCSQDENGSRGCQIPHVAESYGFEVSNWYRRCGVSYWRWFSTRRSWTAARVSRAASKGRQRSCGACTYCGLSLRCQTPTQYSSESSHDRQKRHGRSPTQCRSKTYLGRRPEVPKVSRVWRPIIRRPFRTRARWTEIHGIRWQAGHPAK